MHASSSIAARGAALGPTVPWRYYERLDQLRTEQGAWLERLGWGPEETPARLVLRRPGLTLKGYAGACVEGPPVLLVPAPIKRAYLWDLSPTTSVVRSCLQRGMRPYLVEWERPEAATSGLADYGDRLLAACVEAIRAECGPSPPALVGHSLGGVLAAIFAALHPQAVAALVVLATPLHFSFGREAGALGPLIAAIDRLGLLQSLPERLPGSLLSHAAFLAAPAAFGQERWLDWISSQADRAAVRTHLQVQRWALDELPLARQLVVDLVEQLWRADAFLDGRLRIGGRTAAAAAVTMPLVVVADRGCPVVPPAAILPFHRAAASADKTLLWYRGESGVGLRHVGALVGRHAHARLWPRIFDRIAAAAG